MMKLFPTNLFSSGQPQSDPSQPKAQNAENAFASLLQEGSIEIARLPINDASMGRAEAAHEVVSRSDQAAPKSRRKAEDRDRTKMRGKQDQVRETDDVAARSVDRSRESDRSQSAEDPSRKTASVEQESRHAKSTDTADSQDTAAANGEQVDSSKASTEEVAAVEVSDFNQDQSTDSAKISDTALAQAGVVAAVAEIPTLGLPNLALLAQLEPAGMPVTDAYPLVGATLLSPAALGGIEGLNTSEVLPMLNQNTALSELPTEVLNTLSQASTATGNLQSAGLSGAESLEIGPELLKSLGQNPVLQAATAAQAEALPQQDSIQAEVLLSTAQSASTSGQSLNQMGQSLLGGSVFQELAQKGLQGQLRPQAHSESTLGQAEGTPISELPAEFQQAKAVFAQVNTQPSTLLQHAQTVSQLHGNATDEADVETQTPSTEENTSTLAGLNRNPATVAQNGQSNQSVQVAVEAPQNQKIAQRIAQSTASQQVRFEETAPTPEGHVSPLTEVMVEVDDDLRIAVKTTGREVMVSLDGTARAIEEMAGIGPELQDSLEDMGFTLSQFSTQQDDGQEASEDSAKKSPSQEKSRSTTQTNLGPIRQVRRGGQVDTVA
jgi:hypothetical protein